jgi:hypothetical protein
VVIRSGRGGGEEVAPKNTTSNSCSSEFFSEHGNTIRINYCRADCGGLVSSQSSMPVLNVSLPRVSSMRRGGRAYCVMTVCEAAFNLNNITDCFAFDSFFVHSFKLWQHPRIQQESRPWPPYNPYSTGRSARQDSRIHAKQPGLNLRPPKD